MGEVKQAGFEYWSLLSHLGRSDPDFRQLSLAAVQDRLVDGRAGIEVPAGVWLREPLREMTVFADQYDFAISLLLLDDDAWPAWQDEEVEPDVAENRFAASLGRSQR